jgi:hypothetical protein
MVDQYTLRIKPTTYFEDERFSHESVRITDSSGQPLLTGDRYHRKDEFPSYATIKWIPPSSLDTTERVLPRISQFLINVQAMGLSEPSFRTRLLNQVNLSWKEGEADFPEATLPIDALLANSRDLYQHPHIGDFYLLQAGTPFAVVELLSFSQPWTPASGIASVTSHEDVSKPLTTLLSSLCVPWAVLSSLEGVIKEVFTF